MIEFIYTGDTTGIVKKLSADDLSEAATVDLGGAVKDIAFSPDRQSVYVVLGLSSPVRMMLYKLSSYDLSTLGSVKYSDANISGEVAVGIDGYLYCTAKNTSSISAISKIDPDDLSILSTESKRTNALYVAVGPDGFIYLGYTDSKWVDKIDPDDLSTVASNEFSGTNSAGLLFDRDGNLYRGDRSLIYKIDPSDWSVLASRDPAGSFFYGAAAGASGGVFATSFSTLEKLDASLSVSGSTSLDEARALSYSPDGHLFAGTDLDEVYKLDASDLSTLASFSGHSADVQAITVDRSLPIILGFMPDPYSPPTEQEIFEASFEDVFGRDPQPTPLHQRKAARGLAEHWVIAYLHSPRIVRKSFHVPLEDQHKLDPSYRPHPDVPANIKWIEDPRDPEFSMGRWACVHGCRKTAHPTLLELTLRITNHPNSFVEPPE